MNRIAIIGTSCSGKSTLASVVSKKLGIPHVELDELHWMPNWRERPDDEFSSLVVSEVAKPEWVIDGNYGAVRNIIWPAAKIIIWLDYSFSRVLFRAIKRSVRRAISKEKVCSGNTETFRQSFLSRESAILWMIQTHKSNRLMYQDLLSGDQFEKCDIKIFRHPQKLNDYLASINAQ